MSKRTIKTILLFSALVFIVIYGRELFMSISHNKKVFETNISEYIPDSASVVIHFSRNYHFEEYFLIDSTNRFIIDPIKDYITYPILIVKGDSNNDLILARTTKDQESKVKKIMKSKIAPYKRRY